MLEKIPIGRNDALLTGNAFSSPEYDIGVNDVFPLSVLLRGGRNRRMNVLFVACLRQPEANEADFPNHIDTKRVVSHTRKPPT